MTVVFRSATAEDLAAVMAIERASFPHPWPVSAFESELENSVATFKVAVEGREIIGYYDLWCAGGDAHLLNIAVAAARQGQGWGRRLLTDAIATAAGAGAERLFLEVRPSNAAAVRIYERAGFTHVRRRRRYYEDGEDADVMALALKPKKE